MHSMPQSVVPSSNISINASSRYILMSGFYMAQIALMRVLGDLLEQEFAAVEYGCGTSALLGYAVSTLVVGLGGLAVGSAIDDALQKPDYQHLDYQKIGFVEPSDNNSSAVPQTAAQSVAEDLDAAYEDSSSRSVSPLSALDPAELEPLPAVVQPTDNTAVQTQATPAEGIDASERDTSRWWFS